MSIFQGLGGGSNDEDNMNAFKKAGPALLIFVVAVMFRAGLEMFAPDGGKAMDFSWVTTFAAIAASWLGLGAGISTVLERLGKVEKNTNGKSDEERTLIAREAASHVLAQAQETPVVVRAVVPSSDTETSSVDNR